MANLVLSLSISLQLLAAFLAARQLRLSGTPWAWLCIAVALVLMTIRRTISLYLIITGEVTRTPDLMPELVGLVVSVLMVVGVVFMARHFQEIIRKNESLDQEITDRKKAQESLDRANRDWERTFNAISDLVMILDDQHKILRANKAMADALGMTEQELIGKLCFELVHGMKEPPAFCPHSHLLADGEEHCSEVVEPRLGGIYDVRVSPLIGQNGQVMGSVHVIRDITERKRAEEELKRLTLRNEMILNSAGEGIYGTDIDGNIVFMNEAAQKMLGLMMPDVIDKNSHATFHHTKADGKPYPIEECPLHDALIVGKSCRGTDEVFWNQDGRMFYVEHVNTPLILDGVVVGAVVVFRDVTDRKQWEQALTESEERYRTVADFTYDWEYWVASDGKLLYVSPSCERVTGYSVQEFLDDPGLMNRIVHKDDLDHVIKHFHVARQVDHAISYSLDFRILHRDGHTVWINHACRPVYGKVGQPLGRRACNRDITDRKDAEEALREREEFLSSIVENIPDMIFIKDAKELRFVRFNKAGEELLGYKREDLIAKSDYDFFPKEQADFFTKKDMEVLENGQVYDIPEEPIDTKTGRRILRTKKIPILDKGGNPKYLLGISEDITERKRAEEERLARLQFIEHMDKVNRALQGANDLEQMMQEVLHAVLSIFDCDRAWLFYPCDPDAPSFRVPMEVTKREYPGAKILNVDLPMPQDMAQNLREALESVGPVTYIAGTEKPINKMSADQFGVKSMMMVALYPKAGKPWAFGLHQCSYARVWTSDEERLFQEVGRRLTDGLTSWSSHRRLQESEAKYRRIVETANEGIWVLGPDTMTASVNVRMAHMLGYSVEEMIGRAVTDFMFDADAPDHLRKMENHRQGLSENYERRFRRKDGAIMWALVSATPIFDDEHRFNGAFAMFTDITERKRAEEEKERLQGQLLQAQKMESLGTLAGGIAHDFNNLLQIILGYSDMLLFNKKPTDPDYERIDAIREAGKGGAELAKGILAFGRRLEPNAHPIDLNNEIVRVRKMLERTIPKMITIQVLLADNLMTVNADPGQIEQILLNLAINAQHAMPDGGRLTIETANVALDEEFSRTHLGVAPGKCVLLTVSDTGQGMDKEVMEHIFEPFYTTKGVGEGTGLGLAMVFGIVKSHKGHITCYSEPGRGTEFKIYLPGIVREIEQDTGVTQQMPATGTETILLVDDEESIRKLGEEMLRMAGYDVLMATNGIEALEVYRTNQDRLALVLLDLVMPEMSGKRCLKELLNINPKVKVVIASGFSADATTQEVLASGAKGFANKPYNLRQMLEVVRNTLDAE